MKVDVFFALLIMAICFILVPIIASTVGGWYAYWGAVALSVIWAIIITWLRTSRYWEE
ncbi:MAG: hypothetical protein QXK12_01030 [Candidatus Nezhaarchaeales archaeon]